METKKEQNVFTDVDEEIVVDAEKVESLEDEQNNDQEISMNLQPELGRFAAWRKNRKLKSIIKKEEKAVAKQKEAEQAQNGQITKKELAKAYGWVIAQGAVTLASVAVAVVTPLTGIAFVLGAVAGFSGTALVANIKDAIEKHKEYRKENPKTEKVKQKKPKKEKKQKEKKLGLGKRIKNFFTKSKNKTDDGNEQLVVEPVQIPEPTVNEQTQSGKNPTANDSEVVDYKLDQDGPKYKTVDLSNMNVKPGLDIMIQPFVVKKDDKLMQEMVECYIEKMTGSPAVYVDRVIDEEEKRVYMLVK